jgi:fumarate reductase flavoprotein subunit
LSNLVPGPGNFDAIVIGAGAAGMMAALSAAHRGARVLVLERNLAGPSNFLVSGGLFPGAGTRWQKAAGIEDDAPAFARDIRDKGGDSVNEAIVDAVARRTADAAHFLADVAGVPVRLLTEIPAPGHRVPRLHASPAQSGRELHALLRVALERMPGIEVVDKAEVVRLQSDAGFAVTTDSGIFRAPAVVLATGGFAANQELLAEFIPEVAGALHLGAGPNDGCAIVWGRALGAALAGMDGYQGQGHANPGTGTRLGMALPGLGAFLVNREGRRFVREGVGPSELAALVLAQPGGVALEVFDARIHAIAMRQGPYREAWEAGVVMVAADPEALAEKAGLRKHFVQTFKEISPQLGRPLHAAWVTGALAHTQGGLAVDASARVLRQDGSTIEGLYAAGGAAAGLAGRSGEGYLPGNGLAQCFALGLIAGEAIALLGARAR